MGNIKNIIVVLIILLVVGLALWYIIRQKRKGVKCIGCPSGKTCASKKDGNCSGSCCNCPK